MRRLRNFVAVAALTLAVTACAHKAYELCDEPGCGDNVTIEVEDK